MTGKLGSSAVARLLAEFGQRTALRGGNPYRARAYSRAAESLLALTEPLEQIVAEGRLRDIPGIGEAIADIVVQLHETGTHPKLEALRKEVPEGVLEMLAVPGLAPEKVLQLHKDLGISTVDELEQAARADRLKQVKGLGPALQRKIIEGIETWRQGRGQTHIHRAAELLQGAEANLRRSYPDLVRIEPAGDFRRGCELISDLCLVAESPAVSGSRLVHSGELKSHLTDKDRYGITLLFATGSKAHLEALKGLARKKGLVLDEQGVRRGRKTIASRTEKDIYAALGLPFVEPELREDRGEIELAVAGRLPELVRDEDLRGILHAHTDASDGVNTLEEMAEATRKRGYSYFGVADHSQSAGYAGGLGLRQIEAQHETVDGLNVGYRGKFRIFKGIESDILPDGSLDYPAHVLQRFDFVIASVHSRFRLDRQTQTERMIRAVENPYTTILGHMTGRQLLRRPGYDVDVERVLAACARHAVAVEINGNPWRLDLDWRWHSTALDLGCMMSINPDAHSTSELDMAHWAVEIARKGGVPKHRVLNCLDLDALTELLSSRRRLHTAK